MEMNNDGALNDMDWDSRTLCSDDSCIGVIGSDGYCGECGKKYDADSSETDVEDSFEVEDDENETELAADEPNDESDEEDEDTPADIDWENRELCSDASCIGVIGPGGYCNECGKPSER